MLLLTGGMYVLFGSSLLRSLYNMGTHVVTLMDPNIPHAEKIHTAVQMILEGGNLTSAGFSFFYNGTALRKKKITDVMASAILNSLFPLPHQEPVAPEAGPNPIAPVLL